MTAHYSSLESWDLNNSALIFRRGLPTTPESLACGTPVVATDVGGNPEYLALAGIDDLLVRISNYDFSSDLARRILYALEKYTAQYQFNTIPSFSEMATQIQSLLKKQTI
jgi:glycosyltransferase involved in cell wall biosynthesis